MQQTVVTCVPEVITENDDSQDPACETNIDEEFEISRRQEPMRMTRQNRKTLLHTQGPHNERARGVRHEDTASLAPACSGARVCYEQGSEDSTGSADRSINTGCCGGLDIFVPNINLWV